MTTQIPLDLTFKFESHSIHAFLYQGKPTWLASEIGAALGMTDANKAVRSSKLTARGDDYDVIQASNLPVPESFSGTYGVRAVRCLCGSGLQARALVSA